MTDCSPNYKCGRVDIIAGKLGCGTGDIKRESLYGGACFELALIGGYKIAAARPVIDPETGALSRFERPHFASNCREIFQDAGAATRSLERRTRGVIDLRDLTSIEHHMKLRNASISGFQLLGT